MNFKHALVDLKEGLRSEYPICCILHYCLDSLRGNVEDTVFRYIKGKQYVPCSLHLKAYHRKKGLSKELVVFLENDCKMYLEDIMKP